MAMKAMYNAGAQLSLAQLNKNINKAGNAMAKLATGQRKIGAQDDDTASFAISEKMREQIRSLLQDNQNIQNGSSMIKTAERGIDQIIEELRTLKELAINAANDSNTDEDRRTIQKEFDSRTATINDIAIGTKYNGLPLLDGTWENISSDVDIVFVIDTTGSMGGPIASLASNLETFTSSLKELGFSVQLGLVKYDEINPSEGIIVGVESVLFDGKKLTDDVDTFVSALSSLSVAGGGDYPESGLEAIMHAVEDFSSTFRPGAKKRIIAVSDASVHKKDSTESGETGTSEYTLDDALSALETAGIKLSAVTRVGTPTAGADWGYLARESGGDLYSIDGDYGVELKKEADSYEVPRQNPLWVQHGTQAGQHTNFYINNMQTKVLGIDDAKVTTRFNATSAISKIDGALTYALNQATNLGSYLQRLEYTDSNVTTMGENVQNAESTIRDVDMAKEITEYTKYNILTQSSQAMLAQANQNGSAILSLLQ